MNTEDPVYPDYWHTLHYTVPRVTCYWSLLPPWSELLTLSYPLCHHSVAIYRVLGNSGLKVFAYCSENMSANDILSLLGAHQMWSI